MSKIVGDSQCPACAENGHDSTSNHLIHWEDGGKWCGKKEYHSNGQEYYEPPEGKEVYEDDTNMDWMKYTSELVKKTVAYGADPKRKLSEETIKHFGLRAEFSTVTGEIDKVFYPYYDGKELGYKIRKHFEEGDREVKNKPELLGKFKCFRAIGNVKGSLFNQAKVPRGSKRVLLVEGEEDAPAAYEMLSKYNPRVLSIPSGATVDKEGNGVLDKAIIENLDYLRSFEELIVCFDGDPQGKAISEAIAKLIGPSVKIMEISEKDPSAMLQAGKQVEFVSAFFSAKPYAPEGFVTVDDVWDKATAMPTWGRSWPWPTLTKLTYGRRDGEGMYLGAGVKVGKSEFVNQLVYHCIMNGEEVGLFKLEEDPAMTVRKVAGKLKHKQFHVPDGDFTHQELIEGVQAVKDTDLAMYGKYGTNTWEDIKPAIRHTAYKAKQKGKPLTIILDPLTRLVSSDPSVANKELTEISDEISKMAKDLGFFYLICTHLNAPQSGKPHEEGGKVHSNQFTGSRAMMRTTYYFGGIERDKTAEDEIERNTSYFVLLEDRAFGNSGRFPIYYNRETGDYLEPSPETGLKLRGEY